MAKFADRVKDTSTSTGTGSFTLANSAPTGFQTFAAGLGSAAVWVCYTIDNGSEWEVGCGVFDGTTGLTRDRILFSSNSNALVNFSAGTKTVFCTAPARVVSGSQLGRQLGLKQVGFLA